MVGGGRCAPPALQLLSWGEAGLWGATAAGGLYDLDLIAQRWSLRHRFEAAVDAILVDGAALYAAVESSGIYRSGDGCRNWELVFRASG